MGAVAAGRPVASAWLLRLERKGTTVRLLPCGQTHAASPVGPEGALESVRRYGKRVTHRSVFITALLLRGPKHESVWSPVFRRVRAVPPLTFTCVALTLVSVLFYFSKSPWQRRR